MTRIKHYLAALLLVGLAGCVNSGSEIEVWDTARFAAGNYQTYSWRSEPIVNTVGSRDIIYRIDPLIRIELDRALKSKGYQLIPWNGDFTVDYIYAPGVRAGVAGEDTTNIAPRAGVRPNTNISQAERDNAIALAGVRELHHLALQFNDGPSRVEVWRGVLTEIANDLRVDNMDGAQRTIGRGINKLLRDLPAAN